MYFVYLLKSTINGDIYVGRTDDLKNRYKLHNQGRVKSTKAFKPWILIYYEAYKVKSDATKRERSLKMHAVKHELLKRLESSLR